MITLHMIVKNEAELLPRCLRSIRDFVDEMIIVDTGSTDGTQDAIKEYGARLETFQWCDDFSAARNYALSFVKTPWAMWLDADDLCLNPEVISDILQQAHKAKINSLWSHYWQDETCQQGRLQIFRTKLFRWVGPVHENPIPRNPVFNEGAMTALEVLHCKPPSRTRSAAEYYLQIMLDKDPHNYFGLAESYKFLQRFQEADENYWLAYKYPDTNDSTRYAALFNSALMNYELSSTEPERLDTAIKMCAIGIAINPKRAECYSLLGLCYQYSGQFQKAVKCFKEALSLDIPENDYALVYKRYYNVIPTLALKEIHSQLETSLQTEKEYIEVV